MTRVKICGITRSEDVEAAVKLGVHSLGFILTRSPRQISLDRASSLIKGIPPFLSRVAVVANPTETELEEILTSRLFDCIQFHGQESPALVSKVPVRTIKSFSIASANDLSDIDRYDADYYLFDRGSGGTGKAFDWSILGDGHFKRPFILAGGLSHENLEAAIRSVRPAAVDINSCIESEPGIKDRGLMTSAIETVRNTDIKTRSERS